MTQLEIVVGSNWRQGVQYLADLRPLRPAGTTLNLGEIRDIIDLVVDGRNLTAAVDDEHVFSLFSRIMEALIPLATGASGKAIVEFPTQPFEMVLIPSGSDYLLTLYSVDRAHEVLAFEVPVPARAFVRAVSTASEEMLADALRIDDRLSTDPFIRSFSAQLASLRRTKPEPHESAADEGSRTLTGCASARGGFTLDFVVEDATPAIDYEGEHVFDLHALLVRGSITLEDGSESNRLPTSFPMLAVMDTVRRVRELLNLLESGTRVFECCSELTHLNFEVVAEDTTWHTVWGDDPERLEVEMPPNECLDVVISFAELLVDQVLRLNGRLQLNQRFVDLKSDIEELRGWFADLSETNTYMESPEAYLESHGHLRPGTIESVPADFVWPFSDVVALYPSMRWQFEASQIHFPAIHHSQDCILVPTTESLFVIDSRSGEQRWSASSRSGVPLSSYAVAERFIVLANESADLWLVDLNSGRDIARCDVDGFGTLLMDSVFYPESEMVVAADFQGRLAGFSSSDGRVIWSTESGHGYLTGVAFEGPLVCTLSSPGFLQSFDPLTGRTLWKVRLGGVADSGPHVHQGRLYTLSHDPMTHQLTVQVFHPYTGRSAWQVRLDGELTGQPSFIDGWMVVPIERHGLVQLVGIPLEVHDPGPEWYVELRSAGLDRPTQVCPVEIEGYLHGLVQTDRAEMTCFDVATGEIRWKVEPDSANKLLFRNLELSIVRDAVLRVTDQLELRSIETGELLHKIGDTLESPEHIFTSGDLEIFIGEPADSGRDQLSCFSLGHFLALAKS